MLKTKFKVHMNKFTFHRYLKVLETDNGILPVLAQFLEFLWEIVFGVISGNYL